MLAALTQLQATWPTPPWSWDDRFHTATASFAKDVEPAARASAMLAFPRGWTAKSLEAAPAAMRALAARTGGLRAGQRLLAGDELSAGNLYALWWPWSGGATITLRIGLLDVDLATAPFPQLRALFGV